jgi:hypothetical protein
VAAVAVAAAVAAVVAVVVERGSNSNSGPEWRTRLNQKACF